MAAAAVCRHLGGGAARGTATDEKVLIAVRDWVDAALGTGGAMPGDLHAKLLSLVETTLVEKVVEAADGNRTAAAKLLGLDRATLRSKLNR